MNQMQITSANTPMQVSVNNRTKTRAVAQEPTPDAKGPDWRAAQL